MSHTFLCTLWAQQITLSTNDLPYVDCSYSPVCTMSFRVALAARNLHFLNKVQIPRTFRSEEPAFPELVQLGVFGFGFFQDGDVGVGVFPQREEVVVGTPGFVRL
jgi:hypothetical protein